MRRITNPRLKPLTIAGRIALECAFQGTQFLDYAGFTDIEFNPAKSINCQRSAALLSSLMQADLAERATTLTTSDQTKSQLFLKRCKRCTSTGIQR
jgi:hypothetical protein